MANVIKIALAVALTFCFEASAYASTDRWLKSFAERPYAGVRGDLITAGFRPIRFSPASKPDRCWWQEWCDVYPETEYCSSSGLALCSFAFYNRKSKRYLSVVTYGETRLTVLRVYHLTRDDRFGWHPYAL